jgi:hypothetical protein
VGVSSPPDECQELAARTLKVADLSAARIEELSSFASSVNFVAGVIHPLRPFLAPIWASLSTREANEKGRSRGELFGRFPKSFVKVRQSRCALRWIAAFFNRQRGAFIRAAQYNGRATPDANQLTPVPGASAGSFATKTLPLPTLRTRSHAATLPDTTQRSGAPSTSFYGKPSPFWWRYSAGRKLRTQPSLSRSGPTACQPSRPSL